MINLPKPFVVILVLLFILACQTTAPSTQDVVETMATAFVTPTGQAVSPTLTAATEVGSIAPQVTPAQSPLFTPLALPNMPDDIMNPQSPPLKEWSGIPVMPEAVAGETSELMYVFKVVVTAEAVKEFYDSQLLSNGWSQVVSIPPEGEDSGILIYSKGDQALGIEIVREEDYLIVIITLA